MKCGRILFALSALIVAALACTIGQAAPPTVDLPATITAQALTLQAPSQTSGPPTGTPPPASTNTPALPLASVSSSSNCRKGPNIYYGLLWTMQPGITAEVVGKHTPSRTWIVKYPNGQCWLFGARTTVRGNIAALPEYPQPPHPPHPGLQHPRISRLARHAVPVSCSSRTCMSN